MPDKSTNQPLWRFMYGGRPADDELAYRLHYNADDIKQILGMIYISLGFVVALAIQDISNLGSNPKLMLGIIIRFGAMLLGFYSVWDLKQNRSPRHVDILVASFTGVVAVGMIGIHAGADISAARIVGIGTMIIMVAQIGLPSYAATLAVPIGIIIIGDWILIYTPGREYLREFAILIPMIYLFSAYIATMGSAFHHRARYRAFKSLEHEMHLNAELQEATGAIKLLSGLLPICANCKKIRDDQGYYQQIEHYITEHSEAEFTHGICPDCAKELYPEIGT